jgi:hypothetical protein
MNSRSRAASQRSLSSTLFVFGLVTQFDSVSVGHSIERSPIDAEDIRRAGPIASDRLEDMLDVAALNLLERREIFEEASGGISTGAL